MFLFFYFALDVGGGGGGFYSSGAGNGDSGGKGFLKGGSGGRGSSSFLMGGLVDLVVGPGHVLGVGEVVEVTLVGVVERLPAVVGEDLIMSGEINKITCITGHLLVMVW